VSTLFGSLLLSMGIFPAICAMTQAICACKHVLHLLASARHMLLEKATILPPEHEFGRLSISS
jgi:hypothetical protein